MSDEYMELDINEAGGCNLRLKREFRKGRGNPSQFRKHTQHFNLYHGGLPLALQMLKARLELGPQFSFLKTNISDEILKDFIESLEREIRKDK